MGFEFFLEMQVDRDRHVDYDRPRLMSYLLQARHFACVRIKNTGQADGYPNYRQDDADDFSVAGTILCIF